MAARRSILTTVNRVALNLWFWSAALVVTAGFVLVLVPLVTLFGVLTWRHRTTQWMIRRGISWYGAAVLRCAWPWVRVGYVDLQPDAPPPMVFVANHRSASDAFLMACLPLECIQVMNIWPSRIPVIGWIAKAASYMSVRQMPFDAFLAKGTRLLGQGVSIIAFPEGTRSGSTQMGPFHGSVFRLAMEHRAAIAPLAIAGNEAIPPRGSFWLNPGRITVTKLPAVSWADYRDMPAYTLKTHVRQLIQQHLLETPADAAEPTS